MIKNRLAWEIGIILCIKLVVLLTIKAVWFDKPTVPRQFEPAVKERLLGSEQ